MSAPMSSSSASTSSSSAIALSVTDHENAAAAEIAATAKKLAKKAANAAAKKLAKKAAIAAAKKATAEKDAAEKAANAAAAKKAANDAKKAEFAAFRSTQIKKKLFEEKEECQICCEPLNLSSNKPVVCPYDSCAYKSCVSCIRTYLIGNPQSAAHCMACKKPLNNLFLVQNLTKVWTNEKYIPHVSTILTEMELARLPEAMEDAEKRKKMDELKLQLKQLTTARSKLNEPIKKLENDERKLNNEHGKLGNDKWNFIWNLIRMTEMELARLPEAMEDAEKRKMMDEIHLQLKQLTTPEESKFKSIMKLVNDKWNLNHNLISMTENVRIEECSNKMIKLDYSIRDIQYLIHKIKKDDKYKEELAQISGDIHAIKKKMNELLPPSNKEERKVFTMPCSYNECKGMLSTQYKCCICEKYTCKDCHEQLEDEHKCNPDNVATTQAIKKETRPCPRCNARIFKIEGCDQMWCTSCKTPFSWITGKIVPSGQRLHNPHAIQYLRQTCVTVRAPGDLVCGGVITREQLNQMTENVINMMSFLMSFSESNPGELEETFQNHLPENKSDFSQCLIKSILNNIRRAWFIVDEVSRNKLRESREVAQAHRDFNEERIQIILNKMDKDAFTRKVAHHTREKNIQMEMSHIWELVSTFGIEMFNALYNASVCNNIVSVVSFIKLALQTINEFDVLVKYVNTQFAVVSVAHSISVPTIMIDVTKKNYDLFKNEKFSQIRLKMMMSEQ